MSPPSQPDDDPRRRPDAIGQHALLGTLPEQELLRIVSENARVGLVIINGDRRYAYANTTYAEILGLPSDLVGRRLQDVLADVYEEQIRPRLDRAFAGERIGYELRRQIADHDRSYSVRYEPTKVAGAVFVVVVITDITDYSETQVDSQRFAAIVESSDDAIIGKTLDGIVTTWNEGAERLFGYSAAEMVGTSVMRLIPADRYEEERQILEKIRRNERVRHADTLRRTKSGELISVSITTSPIRDSMGKVIGASKVARDISERKRADEAMRFQQTMLLTERELTLDGILVVDPQSNVLSYNGRFAQMWGIGADILATKADELLLQAVIDKLLDPEKFMQRVRQLYDRHDEASRDEVELKDGRVFDRYSAPMRGADGRYYGRVWYFRDVTERQQAIDALRTAEQRMRFALQSADVGIWDMDYTTGVVRMSEILEKHYGIAPGTFGGTFDAFIEAVHPDDRAYMLETIDKAVKSGADFSTQHRALWRDGTVRWMTSVGRIHPDDQGAPARATGIALDVTERHTLEEQYHHAQKMEAVGRLAGGVAHDFNNMLTAILGYCQLLMGDLGPNDPRRADIEEINSAGESAARLTRQLLAFSRKQIIQPTILDLNAVIQNVRGLLSRLIGEDVKIVMTLRRNLALVKADGGQIEQIVLNLAVNARDAMPNGGTLTIETANVELDEDYAKTHLSVRPGFYVALTVNDTGTGMSPEVQARLFEPFFTTKNVGKGTGLGLATVHGVVKQSGGSIGVYSELGKGTTFTVYLPRTGTSDEVTQAAQPVARPRPTGELVLVVEDADGLRALVKRMLEQHGYRVLLAANASEAFLLFEEHADIDVILTDVIMPGGSGPELTKRLLAQRPGIKAIYMSGYTEDAISHHGVLDPGIAFLHKPFTSDMLGRKLREVLDR